MHLSTNLRAVLEDPNLTVLYGIKDSSALNTLSYLMMIPGKMGVSILVTAIVVNIYLPL